MSKVGIVDIRRKISNLLRGFGSGLHKIASWIHESPQRKRVAQWFADHGDETLRLNYELDENSLVFDLGGYKGEWASDVFSMYCCTIHVFEPVLEFADKIEQRFSRNERIFVHRFGLSNESRTLQNSVNRDSSSFHRSGDDLRDARVVKAINFMLKNHIEKIDLMKINIEGGEYDLLKHLIDSGFIRNIKNIQVQFHDFVPNAEQRMAMIQKKLEKTHSLTYQYLFVWENWRLK